MKKLLLLAGMGLGMLSGLQAQISFVDAAKNSGLQELGPNYGVSFIDVDQDGWEDIFVTRNPGANRLWHNQGDGTFIDMAPAMGLDDSSHTQVAIWADINNDGFLDVFFANNQDEKDRLLLNDGQGSFLDITDTAKVSDPGEIMAAVWGDVDNDGFIDLYIARLNAQNSLYRNNGDLTFTDITLSSGAVDTYIAMGAIFFDYDNDRDQDLYLVHDGYGPNKLYKNDGQGHFIDVAPSAGVAHAALGMGVDVGDVNRDGWLDIYISNLYENALYLNNGNGTFTNASMPSGLMDKGMGWGTAFLDVDNDGWQDIYLANTPSYPNQLFHNQGNNTFSVVSQPPVLSSNGNSFGVACGDYDRDGRMDFYVANSNGTIASHLMHNETPTSNHWVAVRLEGMATNRAAIGARVKAKAGNELCIDEVNGGSSWASQNSFTLHMGLGTANQVDSLWVYWPSGTVDLFTQLPADSIYIFQEGSSVNTSVDQALSGLGSLQFFPNPFMQEGSLSFSLDKSTELKIDLYDLSGKRVHPILNNRLSAGVHQIQVHPAKLSPGMYICRIAGAEGTISRKIIKL